MRILICGLNYAPELTGIGKYTGEMAEWLVAQGHQVRIVTTAPYYPYWKTQKPYRSWIYTREILKGVEVLRCPLWVPFHPTPKRRVLHLFSYLVFAFPAMMLQMRWRPDIVIAIEPSFFSASITAVFSWASKAKAWLHVQDFELDAALALGLLKDRIFTGVFVRGERWVMRQFSRVSAISHSMVRHLVRKGVSSDKTRLFVNWADSLHMDGSLRTDWGIPLAAKTVLYSGNMGRKQGLDIVLDMAAQLKESRPDVLFLMVGDGAARVALEQRKKEENLSNVRFMPLQSFDNLPRLLATADVHLLLQREGVADFVMPSKMGNILSAGGALLATAKSGTELFRIITENNLGVAVDPETQAVLTGVLKLCDDEALRKSFQKRAMDYAEFELNKEVVLRKFEEDLLELHQGKKVKLYQQVAANEYR